MSRKDRLKNEGEIGKSEQGHTDRINGCDQSKCNTAELLCGVTELVWPVLKSATLPSSKDGCKYDRCMRLFTTSNSVNGVDEFFRSFQFIPVIKQESQLQITNSLMTERNISILE